MRKKAASGPSVWERRTSLDPHLGHERWVGERSSVTATGPASICELAIKSVTLRNRLAGALVFFCDPGYKRNLEVSSRVPSSQFRISAVTRRTGYIVVVGVAVIYGLVALRGPQGISALLDKRREVRMLEEQNAAQAAENERRRERIHRLEQNPTEQEMEIRKQLKLLRPGETTFILEDPPKGAAAPVAPPSQP
jgi:cell division protein FtsB